VHRCNEPACFLTLRLSSASVAVTVVLTIPDAVATANATVAVVIAEATALVSQPASALSKTLNVTVEAVDLLVAVSAAVAVPVVVTAPQPPSPPPADGGLNGGQVAAMVISGVISLFLLVWVLRRSSARRGADGVTAERETSGKEVQIKRPSPPSKAALEMDQVFHIGDSVELNLEGAAAKVPPPSPAKGLKSEYV